MMDLLTCCLLQRRSAVSSTVPVIFKPLWIFVIAILFLVFFCDPCTARIDYVPPGVGEKMDQGLLRCFDLKAECGVLLMLSGAMSIPSSDPKELVPYLKEYVNANYRELKQYLELKKIPYQQTWIQPALAFVSTWSIIVHILQTYNDIIFAYLNSISISYCSYSEAPNLGQPMSSFFQFSPQLLESFKEPTGPLPVVGFIDSGVNLNYSALIKKYAGYNQQSNTMSHDHAWFSPYKDKPSDPRGHGTNVAWLAMASNMSSVDDNVKYIVTSCDDGTEADSLTSVQLLSCQLKAFEWLLAPTNLKGENPDPSLGAKLIIAGSSLKDTYKPLRLAYEVLSSVGIIVIVPQDHYSSTPQALSAQGNSKNSSEAEEAELDRLLGAQSSEDTGPSVPSPIITVCSVNPNRERVPFGNSSTEADVAYIGTNLRGVHDEEVQGNSYSAAMLAGPSVRVFTHLPMLKADEFRKMLKNSSVHLPASSGPGVVDINALLKMVSRQLSQRDVCLLTDFLGELDPQSGNLPFRYTYDSEQERYIKARKERELLVTKIDEAELLPNANEVHPTASSISPSKQEPTMMGSIRESMNSIVAYLVVLLILVGTLSFFRFR